jgi:hypothetical protein
MTRPKIGSCRVGSSTPYTVPLPVDRGEGDTRTITGIGIGNGEPTLQGKGGGNGKEHTRKESLYDLYTTLRHETN